MIRLLHFDEHRLKRAVLTAATLSICVFGCAGRLDDTLPSGQQEKDRGDWPDSTEFPAAQDFALLLPRSPELRLDGQTADAFGEALLPKEWVNIVGESFEDTVVEDAFLTESAYEDWHIAAIRIVPCSTLEKIPAPSNEKFCWPAVRIVWQPTVHGVLIRSRVRDSYSDDRAMHVLYDFLPSNLEQEALPFLHTLRNGQTVDTQEFFSLRDRAVERLLNEALALRQRSAGQYDSLKYRTELADGHFERSTRFLKTLRAFSN